MQILCRFSPNSILEFSFKISCFFNSLFCLVADRLRARTLSYQLNSDTQTHTQFIMSNSKLCKSSRGKRRPSENVCAKIAHNWQFILMFGILMHAIDVCNGHGRLIEPPSRSSAFRYGFQTPPNYNDHELYCGGFQRQQKNGGKCGECGDAWGKH